jgi:hypothetical protein
MTMLQSASENEAKKRSVAVSPYYSCDSYVVEPPEVFAGLNRRFGSRAPQILQNPAGKKGTYIAFGKTMFSVGRLGIAGHRLDDPATPELIARGYEGLNPGVYDPAARLKEQAVDGVVGEVMYPGANKLRIIDIAP